MVRGLRVLFYVWQLLYDGQYIRFLEIFAHFFVLPLILLAAFKQYNDLRLMRSLARSGEKTIGQVVSILHVVKAGRVASVHYLAHYAYAGTEYTAQGVREVPVRQLPDGGLKRGQTIEVYVNRDVPQTLICTPPRDRLRLWMIASLCAALLLCSAFVVMLPDLVNLLVLLAVLIICIVLLLKS